MEDCTAEPHKLPSNFLSPAEIGQRIVDTEGVPRRSKEVNTEVPCSMAAPPASVEVFRETSVEEPRHKESETDVDAECKDPDNDYERRYQSEVEKVMRESEQISLHFLV